MPAFSLPIIKSNNPVQATARAGRFGKFVSNWKTAYFKWSVEALAAPDRCVIKIKHDSIQNEIKGKTGDYY